MRFERASVFAYYEGIYNMKRNIHLTDDFILLRPYQASDVDPLYEAARESIQELYKWMSWCHPDYSIEESRTFIESQHDKWEKGEAYNFTITYNTDGLYLGGCGLSIVNRNVGIANAGYWVRTSQTRKGIATAATLLLTQFAFSELKLNRVEIVVAVGNKASLRVAEKAGASKEGILRNRLITASGSPRDAVMLSLIPQNLS